MNNIWYLEHPIYRYEQAVKGLAKDAGLVIVDPENAPADRPGAAEAVPTVTLRPEFRPAPPAVDQAEEPAPSAEEKPANKPKLPKAAKAPAAATEPEKE